MKIIFALLLTAALPMFSVDNGPAPLNGKVHSDSLAGTRGGSPELNGAGDRSPVLAHSAQDHSQC